MKKNLRKQERVNSSIREISVIPGFCANAAGSVLFSMGNTKVICAANISEEVPKHAAERNTGWLSAEYTMLPYSTHTRKAREFQKRDGRSVEIQRLIGRSLRAGINLAEIPGISITVDCDVLQADGGTRTAAITGGYIALTYAVKDLLDKGLSEKNPLTHNIAAISAGIVNKEIMLDLDYSEDSTADADLNIVMNSNLQIVEIQGTGEGTTFTRSQMNIILDMAERGIDRLIKIQKEYSPF